MKKSGFARISLSLITLFVCFRPVSAQWLFQPDDSDTDRFRRHKENYFLFTSTSHWSEVKFQFSVKYRLMDSAPLFLGFTQKSFWNMWDFALSSPFTESNYSPELFYDFVLGDCTQPSFYRLGVEHESNGKAGADSRSLNRVYAAAYFPVVRNVVWMQPKVWVPVIIEKENADVRQFEGNASLSFLIAVPEYREKAALQIELHKGSNLDFRRGAVIINLAIRPLTILGWDSIDILNGSVFLQYWNGVGESLINYNQVSKTLRVGFVLIR